MYSTYQQYQQRGGKLPENEYQVNAQKASEIIDYYTMGQAASAETMKSQLSACECDLIGMIKNIGVVNSGVKSENNDGFSITFASSEEMKASIFGVLKTHLSFPVNLLALSGWSFV